MKITCRTRARGGFVPRAVRDLRKMGVVRTCFIQFLYRRKRTECKWKFKKSELPTRSRNSTARGIVRNRKPLLQMVGQSGNGFHVGLLQWNGDVEIGFKKKRQIGKPFLQRRRVVRRQIFHHQSNRLLRCTVGLRANVAVPRQALPKWIREFRTVPDDSADRDRRWKHGYRRRARRSRTE